MLWYFHRSIAFLLPILPLPFKDASAAPSKSETGRELFSLDFFYVPVDI